VETAAAAATADPEVSTTLQSVVDGSRPFPCGIGFYFYYYYFLYFNFLFPMRYRILQCSLPSIKSSVVSRKSDSWC
jgi:hypothetical protein